MIAKTLTVLCLTIFFSQPAFAVKKEKTFRYSVNAAPVTLDPVQSGTRYANIMSTSIFDTLYEYKYLKRPYALKPNLATAMPEVSSDGLTITIKLKKGVYFTDDPAFKNGKGREVVAQDVVYSHMRHFDPKTRPSGTWLWQGRIEGFAAWKKAGSDYNKPVSGFKAMDTHTIQIKLTKPYPQFMYTLAMGYTGVVAREVIEKYGKEITIHPVGSGPWKLQSFNTKKAVLVRNPKYRTEYMDLEGYDEKKHGFAGLKKLSGRKIPMVDRVEVNFMKESMSRWSSFTKSSEIQNTVLPPELLKKVTASVAPLALKGDYSKKYHSKLDSEFGFVYTNFNMDDPDIGYNKDPKRNEANKVLRCAVRQGWNWRQRIKRYYNGIGQAFPGIILPGIDGYDENISRASVETDAKNAKEMIKKAGWTARTLPVLSVHSVSAVRTRQFFEQFRGWLTRIGYPKGKIKLKTYATFGDYNKAVKRRKAMLIGMGWGLDYPDSENVLQLFYGPNSSPGSNSSNYNNPEYNKLYEKIAIMQPSSERTEIYKKMNKILIDDCVTISGFSRTSVYMWHKDIVMYPVPNVLGNTFKYIDVL